MIIYPPLINDQIPAFVYHDVSTKPGEERTKITIPFSWNPMVPKDKDIKIHLQIKDYFSSVVIYNTKNAADVDEVDEQEFDYDGTATFKISDKSKTIGGKTYRFPVVGQYYKLQIAYSDGDDSNLTYSTAALGRCIDNGFQISIRTINDIDYIGEYKRTQFNEPLYSYQFDFLDQSSQKVLETSGEQAWKGIDAESGTYYISKPQYQLQMEMEANKTYQMNFTITTINGYTETVKKQDIKAPQGNPLKHQWQLSAMPNQDSGYVTINVEDVAIAQSNNNVNFSNYGELGGILFIASPTNYLCFSFQWPFYSTQQNQVCITFNLPESLNNVTKLASSNGDTILSFDGAKWCPAGTYALEVENYTCTTTKVQFNKPRLILIQPNETFLLSRQSNAGVYKTNVVLPYADKTASLGEKYTYGIREIQGNEYSTIVQTEPTILYSDNIFLSDKDKQLKIAFNPKVSSMKETILESKQDTIGGKYPIFYRNGQVRYREIPISGLISYLMDDYEQFTTDEELGLVDTDTGRTTGLLDYNIIAERKFREKVLEWLNNGKPKLFRSMTEGTFIVRLMNVSLSPNDTLGRMLWTFSATAYEMAENTYKNLKEYDLIETEDE